MAIENVKIANGTAVPVKDVEAHSLISSLTSTVSSLASTVDGKPAFANLPNRNLLDNWYFANPRNTTGSTTYTAAGQTIDGWRLSLTSAVNPSVTVSDGCTILHNETATGTPCSCFITQAIGNLALLAGKRVTFSVKFKSIAVSGQPRLIIRCNSSISKALDIVISHANSVASITTTVPTDVTSLDVCIGAMKSSSGDGNYDIELVAAKLELGSVSTLANDAPPRDSDRITESAEKTGHYYRMSSGEKEWINPPMVANTEYRTAERWNGSVVYAKLVNVGKLPNKASMTVTITEAKNVKSITGNIDNGKYDIPIWTPNAGISNIYFTKSNGELSITTDADMSQWTGYLIIKYTK